MKSIGLIPLCACLLAVVTWSCSGGGTGVDGGDGGDGNDGGGETAAEVYLDDQPLQIASGGTYPDDINLVAGVHRLELRNAANVTLSGKISGVGSLNVSVVEGGTLSLSGKQQHQGTILVSGNLDLVRVGYEFGKLEAKTGASIRRLAIPTDISSDLRAWFDASDVNSTFTDAAFSKIADTPGATVLGWKNRAWKWPNATQKIGPVTRTSDMKSINFNGGAFQINDIYLKDQASFVAVIRPQYQTTPNPTAVFTSTIVENIAPFVLGIGNTPAAASNIPQVALGTYNMIEGGWKTLTEIQLDFNKLVVLGSSIGPGGALLQVDGVTYRASKILSMYKLPETSALGQYKYFIARRWDGDDTFLTDISELVVVADTSSFDAITGYIAWHNKLEARLPLEHPYKTQPPIAVVTSNDVTVQYSCPAEKTCADHRKPLCGPLCSIGEVCISDADCGSWKCTNKICAAPVCSPACTAGAKCSINSHCASKKCEAGVCVA